MLSLRLAPLRYLAPVAALAFSACPAPTLRAQTAEPLLSSWFTANSGKYARLYATTAAESTGTTLTTWSRGQGTQTLPVYSDISEVNSSANWIYIRTSNLPSHVMGPWYGNTAKTQLFPNYPANRAEVFRFPRTPAIPATKTATAGGSTGKAVNGVSLFDSRDAFSYINATGADAGVGGTTNGDGIWNRDAYFNESVTFDPALAHQAGSQYHYHAQPIALRHQLGDNIAYNAATNRYSENPAAASAHSPILGWARDGLPVYGPYGYASALDPASGIRRMVSGYTLRDGTNGSTAITVRQVLPAWAQRFQNRTTLTSSQYGPAVNATYALGRYIEDFAYRGDLGQTQGVDFDLNEYNVRWCVTPEYPSGTYAYFTTIKADGTPMYPYTTGRQYFGSPTGGATTAAVMNADTPLTRQFTGGPNQPLAIPATPTVSGGVVSVAWTAVEGATYSVAASTDNTTYTAQSTGLVATGTTRSTTYAALSTSGTEYSRVTRTALPSYDTNGFSAATVAQTTTTSFTTGPSFALFQVTHFTAEELLASSTSGAAADPDADGLPNLLEYAFDLDPRSPDAPGATSATIVSGHLELSYLRRTDDVNEELSYDVESSSDLLTWDTTFANLEEVAATPVPDTAVERITVRDLTPLDPATRRFLRLRVTQN